jgi:hypothetical protein
MHRDAHVENGLPGLAGLVNQDLIVNIEDADFRLFADTGFLACGAHGLSERFRLAL